MAEPGFGPLRCLFRAFASLQHPWTYVGHPPELQVFGEGSVCTGGGAMVFCRCVPAWTFPQLLAESAGPHQTEGGRKRWASWAGLPGGMKNPREMLHL